MNNPTGKTKAIIAYITFIGFFIAISMNKDHRDSFASWHIKNMFGLLLLLFITIATLNYGNLLLGQIMYWVSAFFWAFSLIMAIFKKEIGIPYFSGKFQQWFTFLD